MIKTLSPNYKTIPWMSPSSGLIPDKYILNVYVWKGLKADVPLEPNYERQNLNPLELTDDTEIDISSFVNDFIDYSLVKNTTTSVNDGNCAVWVKTEVIYYIGGVAQSPEFIEIDLAVKGYSYGSEDVNQGVLNDSDLISYTDVNVYKKGFYLYPFLASESLTTTISLESESKTIPFSISNTTNSNSLVKSVFINVNDFKGDSYIEIYKDSVLKKTLLIIDEKKYKPIEIAFINKEGSLELFPMFKERVNSITVEKESYKPNYGKVVDGYHQHRDFNVNGKDSFKVNTGFLEEDRNDDITQLLLSELLWVYSDNLYLPITLKTSSIEYKSRLKDRLLNYTIEFEYAFNKKQ